MDKKGHYKIQKSDRYDDVPAVKASNIIVQVVRNSSITYQGMWSFPGSWRLLPI